MWARRLGLREARRTAVAEEFAAEFSGESMSFWREGTEGRVKRERLLWMLLLLLDDEWVSELLLVSEIRDFGGGECNPGGDEAAAAPEVAMQVVEEHVDSQDRTFIAAG